VEFDEDRRAATLGMFDGDGLPRLRALSGGLSSTRRPGLGVRKKVKLPLLAGSRTDTARKAPVAQARGVARVAWIGKPARSAELSSRLGWPGGIPAEEGP